MGLFNPVGVCSSAVAAVFCWLAGENAVYFFINNSPFFFIGYCFGDAEGRFYRFFFFNNKITQWVYLTQSKSVDSAQMLSSADWRVGTLTIFNEQ